MSELLRAYPSAPVARMVADPQVRAAWDKIAAALELDLDAGLGQLARALGVPFGGDLPVLAEILRSLDHVQAASVSLELREGSPGEFRDAAARVREAARELEALGRRLDASAEVPGTPYPTDLQALGGDPAAATDPWGRAYVYERRDGGASYELRCLGSDGLDGGAGEAADLEALGAQHGAHAATDVSRVLRAELAKRAATLAIVDFSDAESAVSFRAWIERALAQEGAAEPPPSAPNGLRRFGDAWTLALEGGARIAIGYGAAEPGELEQRSAGNLPGFDGEAMRSRVTRACGEAKGACVVRGAVRASRWLDAAADVGGDDPLSTLAEFLPRHWFVDSSWRMHLDGERFVSDAILAGESDGADWSSVFGEGPVGASAAGYVPGDAIGAALFTLDAQALYASVAQWLGRTDESSPLAELESKHGFRLKEDVFESLGSGGAVYLLPIQSVMNLPGAAIVVELKDAQAFERGITGLMQAFGERPDAPIQTKFKRYRDTPMWTLATDGSAPSNPLTGMTSPTLAIAKDRAIVTVTSLRAIKEVKRALGEESTPHAIAARMADLPPGVNLVGELDWPALVDGVYGAARAGLTLAAAGAELPFDVAALSAALPESKVFTRFFRPTSAWTRTVDGATHAHVESSFGPETWLGGALLAGAVVDSIEHRASEAASEAVPVEPDADAAALEATNAALKRLATPLAVYQIEFGRYPDGLKALVEPTERFPQGFLNGAELPLDGWGRALAYRALDGGTSYRLWSLGPNGVDDAGSGDDVVAP